MTNTNLPFPQFIPNLLSSERNKFLTKTEGVPSSWTKGKIVNLLLLSGFFGLSNAGKGYENCISSNSITDGQPNYYNALVSFVNDNNLPNNQLFPLCCNSTYCLTYSSSSSCQNELNLVGKAIAAPELEKVGQTVVGNNDDGCIGIVGNVVATDAPAITDCSNNLSAVIDYASSLSTSNITGLEQGYAQWICTNLIDADSPCYGLTCGWDNCGWTCFSDTSTCILQWIALWPGSPENNPSLSLSCPLPSSLSTSTEFSPSAMNPTTNQKSSDSSASIISSTIFSNSSISPSLSSSLSSTPLALENNKFSISLIIGTTVGGTSFFTGGSLVYYCWRKRRKQRTSIQSRLIRGEEIPSPNVIELEEVNQTNLNQETSPSVLFKGLNDVSPPNYSEIVSSNSEFARLVRTNRLLLNERGAEFLDNFLGAQEALSNANSRTLFVLQQTYQRAKRELTTVISEKEISALEKAYQAEAHQTENNQLVAQIQQVNY